MPRALTVPPLAGLPVGTPESSLPSQSVGAPVGSAGRVTRVSHRGQTLPEAEESAPQDGHSMAGSVRYLSQILPDASYRERHASRRPARVATIALGGNPWKQNSSRCVSGSIDWSRVAGGFASAFLSPSSLPSGGRQCPTP